MRWVLLVLKLLGLALLLGAAAAVWLAFAPAGDASPHPFNHDRNAVWLEHRWLERGHPGAEMEELFSSLSRRGITYAFPHLIPFNSAGRLPLHNREQMRALLAVARRVAPEVKVLPWVGGLRSGWRRARSGTIDLDDMGQRQRMVAECRGLVDEGFDGIHLHVEPVDDGNDEFLSLLQALRTAVGSKALLSISAIRPGPFRLLFAPNLLKDMPSSALAAVVIAAAIGLFEFADLRRILRIQPWEFWLSIVCFIGVAVFGVIPGIGIAIGIAILEFLWDGWRPHYAVLGRV